MAQGIKNRVFGSDVPEGVKRKVVLRQALSKNSINPLDPVDGSAINVGEDSTENYRSNFGGLLDLSSRTPAVRMWTCVNVSHDIVDENLLSIVVL